MMQDQSDGTPSGTSLPPQTTAVDRSPVPWQVDWKNPTWNRYSVPKDDDNNDDSSSKRDNDRHHHHHHETIVGISTAQVQGREIASESPSVWQTLGASTDDHPTKDDDDDDDDDSWLLTVTLLDPSGESFRSSTNSQSQSRPVATEILLELMQCDETREIRHSRRLVWPETMGSAIARRRKQARNKSSIWADVGDFLLPWWKLDSVDETTSTKDQNDDTSVVLVPSDTGVVAATLCRQPQTKQARREEALEVISSMLVGLGPSVVAVSEESTVEGKSRLAAAAADNEETTTRMSGHDEGVDEASSESSRNDPLCLACISSLGLVCIYSVWDLLSLVVPLEDEPQESSAASASASSISSELGKERAMAAWMLGAELFQQLESTWLPLSQPKTTISLSILNEDWNPPKESQPKEDDSTEGAENEGQQCDDETEASLPNKAISNIPPPKPTTNLLAWNPWIEASTLPHRTIYNRATSIHVVGPSFPFLVIVGQGIPQNSPVFSSKKRKRKRKSSVTLNEEHSETLVGEVSTAVPTAARGTTEDWWKDADGEGPISGTTNSKAPTDKPSRLDTQSVDNVTKDSTSSLGGFITFCSMASWSESKTLFLDFVPRSVTHIEHWHGMELLLCIGDDRAVAIRMDSLSSPVLVGIDEELKTRWNSDLSNTGYQFSHQPTVSINRFQILPVDLQLPTKSNGKSKMKSRVLCGAGTAPPALLQIYTEIDPRSQQEQGLLVMPSFVGISEKGSIITSTQESGRVAPIPVQREENQDHSLLRSAWGYLGQGWSLFGTGGRVYFLCWEGATASRGVSFLQELPGSPVGTHSPLCVASVVPCPALVKAASRSLDASASLPFMKAEGESSTDKDAHTELSSMDLVAQAVQSISSIRQDEKIIAEGTVDSLKDPADLSALSHQQKSERLLRHVSSWTQLEEIDGTRDWLDHHVPVVAIKSRRDGSTIPGSLNVLSMRQIVMENGIASPFSQVLGWLSRKQDYFTAASIALDLLRDPETLYHLWKHAEKIDEEDEQTKLKGLLDGIMPVKTMEGDIQLDEDPTSATWTQLADMTVGCLIKGGLAMSKTLILFLQTNQYYDPSRASLMLVAAIANTVSGDEDAIVAAMGSPKEASRFPQEYSIPELLWPLQCLLEIGVARDYLNTTLNLVNATIPDELRRRPRQGAGMTLPPLELTKTVVTMVISCDSTCARLLLDLPSDQSSSTFWESLDNQTQQTLVLIEIRHKYPLLMEEEVRGWVRKQLHYALKGGEVSIEWLRGLVTACLFNAGCDLQDFVFDPTNMSMMSIGSENSTVWADLEMDGEDGLFQYKLEIVETRNALEPSPGSGGLDFDVLISCLLLLQSRQEAWRERSETFVATQALLDAACHLAGRPTARSDEPRFSLDAKTLMEECALSGNVRAGANLIGGRDGFILSCCNILMLELQISMEEAETFFLNETLDNQRIITEESSKFQQHRFELTESHRQILWLLDEYVLSVRTYGEFESNHYSRGRVDPVFAARSIFRAWLCLTHFCKRQGSDWICRWLVGRLGLERDATGRHRLACAAMVRALLWPSDGQEFSEDSMTPDSLLGHALQMDKHFLIQLAHSSCGLVESVPPPIAEGLIGLADAGQELSTSLGSLRLSRTV